MTAQRAEPLRGRAGCVLAREVGVLVVLTDDGPVRASYGAAMLARIARSRAAVPEPGEWVSLFHWPDGAITVQDHLARLPRTTRALARVVRLHPRPA